MARAQRLLVAAVVHDLDGVGKKVAALAGRRFFLDETGLDGHADAAGLGLVHRRKSLPGSLEPSPTRLHRAGGSEALF